MSFARSAFGPSRTAADALPQAFSDITLVNAAHNLTLADRRRSACPPIMPFCSVMRNKSAFLRRRGLVSER